MLAHGLACYTRTCSSLAVEDSTLCRNNRLHAGRIEDAEEDCRREEAAHDGEDIVAVAPAQGCSVSSTKLLYELASFVLLALSTRHLQTTGHGSALAQYAGEDS